jgi:NADPH-dependent 2,4-dienoyl-CoA reductase/sulfur reductase-like enzyme
MSLKDIVVVGANVAGLRAVETLRASGFDGKITLINGEAALPYNRPPLSKEVLTGRSSVEEVTYRPQLYFDDLRIDLRSGELATSLDLSRQVVNVGDEPIRFDGLIIATGTAPRRLAGYENLLGVHVMRTVEDARLIRCAFEGSPRVAVIGAGFIGSEVAASARAAGLTVTIIEMLPIPLARALGPEMGRACAKLHHDHGTELRCATVIERIEGNGRVEQIRMGDGTVIEADVVVVGVGVVPNVGWLSSSGLSIGNGLVCDAYLNAGHPAVYAAGDLVWWPNGLFGKGMRCEHWTNGAEQGRVAARNLLAGNGSRKPYEGSCYFWSDQYGSRIQFVGIPNGQATVVQGSVDAHEFVAFYRDGERVVGALGINAPKALMKAKLLIERRASWDSTVAAINQ